MRVRGPPAVSPSQRVSEKVQRGGGSPMFASRERTSEDESPSITRAHRLLLSPTHRTLAKLAGARRPSVTAALGELARRDLVVRAPDGWVLKGDPPAPLAGLEADTRERPRA